jgi:hypothetical protein
MPQTIFCKVLFELSDLVLRAVEEYYLGGSAEIPV